MVLVKNGEEIKEPGGNIFDDIYHPARYCEGRAIEPKDVMMSYDPYAMIFFTMKYISRCGRKDEQIKEIRKMIAYLDFMIQYQYDGKEHRYDKYEVVKDWNLPKGLAMPMCILMDVADDHFNSYPKCRFIDYKSKEKFGLAIQYLEDYLKELESYEYVKN